MRTFEPVASCRITRHPAFRQEDAMHLISADTAFQLASDRREQLLAAAARRRRLRRRPVAAILPGTPRDAA